MARINSKNSKINTNLSDSTKFSQDSQENVGKNLRSTKQSQNAPETASPPRLVHLGSTESRRGSEASDQSVTLNEIRDLLKKNVEQTQQLIESTSKIRRWIITQRIWGIIKILIILIPLVIGAFYLPSLIDQVIAPYREALRIN